MSKVIQPFNSVSHLALSQRLVLPKPHDWRLMDAETGCIHGLPEMRGVCVATNGILIAILVDDAIIFGHVDWWVADKDSATSPAKPRVNAARERMLAEYN